MNVDVVFIQGGGDGAHREDAELARSLGEHLGDGYRVAYPEMPDEGDPDYERWRPALAEALEGAEVLVAHSIGGYVALRYLAEERPVTSLQGILLIAAPFPRGDRHWIFDGFELPDHFARALPQVPVFLYASPDDAVVPFAHRDLYRAAIAGSVTRTTSGGHQLGGDLRVVAADIASLSLGG